MPSSYQDNHGASLTPVGKFIHILINVEAAFCICSKLFICIFLKIINMTEFSYMNSGNLKLVRAKDSSLGICL